MAVRELKSSVRSNYRAALVLASLASVGCSYSPPPLAPPKIASDAPDVVIASFDTNKDGTISGDELNSVPSLKAGLKRADANRDGKLSADELAARIATWQKSQIALTRAVVHVRQNGQPLSEAEVTLVPEEFLGPAIKPARGKTDSTGTSHVKISADRDEAGVQLGYYRVQISKKSADGKESIPARYNDKTEFGVEIAPDDPNLANLNFDISTR